MKLLELQTNILSECHDHKLKQLKNLYFLNTFIYRPYYLLDVFTVVLFLHRFVYRYVLNYCHHKVSFIS